MGQKALLKDAAAATGLTKNALYQLARAKKVPFLRVGNRYIFDVELLEQSLREMALENVRQPEPPEFGKLRVVR